MASRLQSALSVVAALIPSMLFEYILADPERGMVGVAVEWLVDVVVFVFLVDAIRTGFFPPEGASPGSIGPHALASAATAGFAGLSLPSFVHDLAASPAVLLAVCTAAVRATRRYRGQLCKAHTLSSSCRSSRC